MTLKMVGYCALCRAKEIELFGTVLNKADRRHTWACELAGCHHPAIYTMVNEPTREQQPRKGGAGRPTRSRKRS